MPFHQANNIRLEDNFASPSERKYIATHAYCDGELSIQDDDWLCNTCNARFHDDHCADLVAERRDKIARDAASRLFATCDEKDAAKAIKQLSAERKSIHEELLKKRADRVKLRSTSEQ